jgi:hypothetical protein
LRKLTLDVYGPLLEGVEEAAMGRLDELLKS